MTRRELEPGTVYRYRSRSPSISSSVSVVETFDYQMPREIRDMVTRVSHTEDLFFTELNSQVDVLWSPKDWSRYGEVVP